MSDFDNYIKGSQKVLLITSQPLDPDCISSGIVMKKYLEHLGLDVTFRFPRELTPEEISRFSFLPLFTEFVGQDTRDFLNKSDFDALILLDGVNWIQFYDKNNQQLAPPILDKNKKIIQIDHHAGNPEDLTSLQVKNSKASSTIEIIVTDIIPSDYFDADLATLAYTGLIGDTGNFKWNFTSTTLKTAALLLEKGAAPQESIERLFSLQDRKFMDMLNYALSNIEYDDSINTVFFFLPLSKQQVDGIDEATFKLVRDAFIHKIAKDVNGYPRGIFIGEAIEKNKIKVSARGSNLLNKIDLRELFTSLGGNGGGHFHAAGMEITEDFDNFKARMKQSIKDRLLKTQPAIHGSFLSL